MIAGLLPAMLAAAAVVSAEVPQEQDGRWIEMRSPTFVLVTDAGERAGRHTIARFEKIRAAFAAALPSARLSGERELLIVAACDEPTLRSLVRRYGEQHDGRRPATIHLTGRDRTFILVRTDLRDDDDESYHAAHWGYASQLLDLNAPNLPLWAYRGLADYYARTTIQKERVLVGRTAPLHVRTLRERGFLPLADLYAVDRHSPEYLDARRLRRFDAQSWALVHHLMLGDKGIHRPLLGQFLGLLGEGREPAEAAVEAFGDPEVLEKELRRYVQSQAFYTEAIEARVDRELEEIPARSLSAAEALTLRAAVHLAGEEYTDSRACLEEALRLEPKLAWAHEVRAALAWAQDDPEVAREAIAEALRLDPDRALSRRLERRIGGPPTLKGAERLCEGGDLPTCAQLGAWLLDGEGGAPDPTRAVALIERACTGGEARACEQLAWRFDQGRGVAADGGRARGYLEGGCAAGDGTACLRAAARYRSGGDPAKAARLLEAACTTGEKSGCLALGWALQTGEGVTRDVERAAALYQDSCQAGDGPSCTRLGLLYSGSDGLATDLERARPLLEKGCALGDDLGCSTLESLTLAKASAPSSP